MSPDDDILRDALRGDAGTSTPAPNAWSKVRDRAGAIRRRRRVVQRGTAVVAAAAIAAGVMIGTNVLDGNEHTVATPPSTGAEIVAVQGPNNGGDALVVLSADDGHVIRTLTEDIGITFGGISATPDGETIYFARLRTALPCDRIEIAKVSRDGGDVEVIGPGSNSLVSPDGRTLAYVRPPGGDSCRSASELVRLDLSTGQESVTTFSEGSAELSTGAPRVPLAWAADGERLVLAACCTGQLWSAVMLQTPGNDVTLLDVSGPSSDATVLPDGRVLVALDEQAPPDGAQLHRLLTFDPSVVVDFRIPSIETIFESRQGGVLHLDSNASGDVLLHFGGDLLQRWHPGDAEPITIATDIGDAAWLPAEQSPTPDVTTTTVTAQRVSITPPNNLVIARADRRLEVINADGTVVRSIGTASLDYHTLALAPDGVTLYYEQGGTDRCSAGEIGRVRIDEDPLEFEHLVNGSFMSLSPDGTKLAYRDGACGIGGLIVRDLETGDQRGFHFLPATDGGLQPPEPELVGPIGWAADGERIMIRVNREPTTEFWFVSLPTDDDILTGPVFGATGEPAIGPIDFAPLGTTGRWAAVVDNVGGPSLVEYDLDANESVRPLAELPDFGARIVGTDPTGQHILLLVPSEGGFDLYRWSGGAVATLVAEEVAAADW